MGRNGKRLRSGELAFTPYGQRIRDTVPDQLGRGSIGSGAGRPPRLGEYSITGPSLAATESRRRPAPRSGARGPSISPMTSVRESPSRLQRPKLRKLTADRQRLVIQPSIACRSTSWRLAVCPPPGVPRLRSRIERSSPRTCPDFSVHQVVTGDGGAVAEHEVGPALLRSSWRPPTTDYPAGDASGTHHCVVTV